MHDGRLSHDRVVRELRTTRIGQVVEVFDELDSTNRHVLTRVQDGEFDGIVVLAEHQTTGRGRRGRRWDCPNGAGILCTVGICDDGGAIPSNLLSLVVPIAVCDGIRAAADVDCEIKWPNDLLVGDRKLAGILIEARMNTQGQARYAIGFGVNCLQRAGHFDPELRARATSLDIECQGAVDRTDVLVSILRALDAWLASPEAWSTEDVRARWIQRAKGMGGRVCVEHDGRRYRGNLIDIDPTSAIVVQLDEGGRRLFDAASTTVIEQSA
jgi:BirA family biotin operon repressor/biotin-[acetyl-CoA-carboxylase] ligase